MAPEEHASACLLCVSVSLWFNPLSGTSAKKVYHRDTEKETQRRRHREGDTEKETQRRRHREGDTEKETQRRRHREGEVRAEVGEHPDHFAYRSSRTSVPEGNGETTLV